MTESSLTNLGRAVMWILVLLIHIQFWVGFNATWIQTFPDAHSVIHPISIVGGFFGIVPTALVANRIIP